MRRPLRRFVPIAAALLQTIWPALTDRFTGAEASRLLAQAAAPQWADALRPGGNVTSPRLIKEVKPRYTAEAMGAKIQGTVLLECVVETDGTVRRVLVVRSLDRRFGLDETAIEAVKGWQFEPGTKDGQPVPVLVTVELSFALRDPPAQTAPLMLPEAYRPSSPGDAVDDSAWVDVKVPSSPLTVEFRHPKEWQVLVGAPGIVFLARPPDSMLGVFMLTPMATTVESVTPGTEAELQQGGKIVASGFNRQLAAVGQTMIAGRMWVWFDMGVADVPSAEIPGLPLGRSQLWIFTTAVDGQQLIVACVIAEPDVIGRRTDWQVEARRAGPIFRKILEDISFGRVQ